MKVVKLLEENEGLEKTISETIEKDLEINELDRDMVYDTTLQRRLIHISSTTQWDKVVIVTVCLQFGGPS